jgi:threonine/homoserine/homoserine lactone efflux protein
VSFYGVTDLWTYVVGAFGIILLPGPNSLYVLSVATARGVRAGFQGAYGVFVGDTVLLLCTALGAASLLRTHPALVHGGEVCRRGLSVLDWSEFAVGRAQGSAPPGRCTNGQR